MMRNGLCAGGPFDGRPLIHHEPRYRVAIRDGKAILAVGPLPDTTFYEYEFDDDTSTWIWRGPADWRIHAARR